MSDLDARLRANLEPADSAWRSTTGQRDAAVLAPVVQRAGEDWLVFTLRRDDLPSHAGEMSFPGGGREGEEAPLRCALREAHEEIGLAPEEVDIFGRMRDLTSREGYRVAAFAGRIPTYETLRPDPSEVAQLVPIPLAELRREERWTWRPWSRGEVVVQIPYFEHESHLLWGLTAMLTQQLLRAVRAG